MKFSSGLLTGESQKQSKQGKLNTMAPGSYQLKKFSRWNKKKIVGNPLGRSVVFWRESHMLEALLGRIYINLGMQYKVTYATLWVAHLDKEY
jgi:hypothetical protein